MKLRSLLPFAAIWIAAASSSQAAVVYSGLQNISISSTFTSLYLDVDAIASSGTQMTGWDVDAFFGGEAFGNSASFQPVRKTTANNSAIVRLYIGDLVDASDVFAAVAAGSSTHIGNAADQFASGSDGYLGFRLTDNSSGGPYYGWMRVNFSNTGSNGTLIDWAYETTGAGISVGAVPEPASSALLGLGCTLLALRRRRA